MCILFRNNVSCFMILKHLEEVFSMANSRVDNFQVDLQTCYNSFGSITLIINQILCKYSNVLFFCRRKKINERYLHLQIRIHISGYFSHTPDSNFKTELQIICQTHHYWQLCKFQNCISIKKVFFHNNFFDESYKYKC